MSLDNENVDEKKEESKVLSQIGEDSGAVIEQKPKSINNDKLIEGEGNNSVDSSE